MICKFEHGGACYNSGSKYYKSACEICDAGSFITNEENIKNMTFEELCDFIDSIAFGRNTPWSEPFEKICCSKCPTTHATIVETGKEYDFHECDFVDGVCPYGDSTAWWLKQKAERSGK